MLFFINKNNFTFFLFQTNFYWGFFRISLHIYKYAHANLCIYSLQELTLFLSLLFFFFFFLMVSLKHTHMTVEVTRYHKDSYVQILKGQK